MNINMTLVVQVLLFLITYKLLRIILFDAVLLVIARKDREVDTVQKEIHELQKVIALSQQEKDAQWAKARQLFEVQRPLSEMGGTVNISFPLHHGVHDVRDRSVIDAAAVRLADRLARD